MMKEVIILAGGFGTRLQSVVNELPKPMAPVKGEPFLNYLFDYLIRFGVEHVVLSTGYLHEKIENHYKESYKTLRISYAQEETPLGTGGAIKYALTKCTAEDVLILNGDTLFCIDLKEFYLFYKEKQTDLAIALREVEEVSRYGSVLVDASGKITSFTEKNSIFGQGYINGGVYLLKKDIFNHTTLNKKFSFEKDFLEACYSKENFYAYKSDGYFIDIGIPKDYQRAQNELPSLF